MGAGRELLFSFCFCIHCSSVVLKVVYFPGLYSDPLQLLPAAWPSSHVAAADFSCGGSGLQGRCSSFSRGFLASRDLASKVSSVAYADAPKTVLWFRGFAAYLGDMAIVGRAMEGSDIPQLQNNVCVCVWTQGNPVKIDLFFIL